MDRLEVSNQEIYEGILVHVEDVFRGCSKIEISPVADVVVKFSDDLRSSSHSLENYDQLQSKHLMINLPAPQTLFPKVRFTKIRENEISESEKDYRVNTYIREIIEDLEEGTKKEIRYFDFFNSGELHYKRTIEGILEEIPKEKIQERFKRSSTTLIGIRSHNKKYLSTIVFNSTAEIDLSQLYGNQVKLEEAIWRHKIGWWGHEIDFQQKLYDLKTGNTYDGGVSLKELGYNKTKKFIAQAKLVKKLPDLNL